MTQFYTRAALIALSAAALGACQTPGYPTREGYTPPPPLEQQRPQYPTTQSDAPPPVISTEALPPATAAPPSTGVESSSIPPLSQADVAPTPPEPPAARPQPDPEPEPPPPPPPPRYDPPPPERPAPPRMVATATGRVVTVSGQTQTYVVHSGDTVDALARRFDTTRRVIIDQNDLEAPYHLRLGQRLRLPAPDRRAYVVVAGDTLYQVSRRFSVRVEALRAANGLSSNASIRAGQRLVLPVNARDLGPQRRPDTSQQASNTPPPRRPTVTRPPPGQAPGPDYTPPQQYASAAPPSRPPAAPRVESAPPPQTRPNQGLTAEAPSHPPPTAANPPPARPYTPPAPVNRPPTANVAGAPPSVPNAPPVADTQIASLGRGRFIWPVQGNVLSTYGPKAGGRRNDGIDISGLDGSVVRAAAAGEIVYAGDQVPGFGNLVLIKHADGWVTAYAHLGRVSVQMRQMVQQGQEIGSVGTTGGVTEPQLHFEVRYAPTPADRARPVDPALVLPR